MTALAILVGFAAGLYCGLWICYRSARKAWSDARLAEAQRDALVDLLCETQIFMERDRIRWAQVEQLLFESNGKRAPVRIH